jgi:hypothetical protein
VADDQYFEEREHLRAEVERDEQELREAVEELKDAISRPFHVIERVKENPLPWMITAVLAGFWFGSRRRDIS